MAPLSLDTHCTRACTHACTHTSTHTRGHIHIHYTYTPLSTKRNPSDLKSSRTIFLSDQSNGTTLPETCSASGLEFAQGSQDYPGSTYFLLSPSPPTGLSCWAWSLTTCASMTMLRSVTETAAMAKSSSVSVATSGPLPSAARAPHSTFSSILMAPRILMASMPFLRRSQVTSPETNVAFCGCTPDKHLLPVCHPRLCSAFLKPSVLGSQKNLNLEKERNGKVYFRNAHQNQN